MRPKLGRVGMDSMREAPTVRWWGPTTAPHTTNAGTFLNVAICKQHVPCDAVIRHCDENSCGNLRVG